MQCGSKSVKILAFLWIQHILTYAGKSRFALFPDIGQENYNQRWLWTNLIHIFWTLTAKRFHGYYLSDFTLNIFGYDPFGNKMQISTIFCEMICRPAAAMILPTTIFLIAHLNCDTWIFSGLHQSWPGVTCLTYNSSKSEKGWFFSHQEDHFCDCFWMAKRQTFALSRQYIFQKLYM